MDKLFDFEDLKTYSEVQWNQLISDHKRQEQILSTAEENARLVANLQTVMVEVAERCFQKCISSPGTALTRREKDCLQTCTQPHGETCELLQRLEKELKIQNDS